MRGRFAAWDGTGRDEIVALIRFLRNAFRPEPRPLVPVSPPALQSDVNALIEAHLAGDPRAFAEIVTRYQVRLLNFVYRMIGDRERAEDLVQEAFLRVHRHLGRFDRSRKFSTWAYTIASNLAKNELRNRGRSPLVRLDHTRPELDGDERPLEFEDVANRPDDMYHQRQLKRLVDDTVAQLSSHHREVFVLRELEGKSYEEIADIMHCNLGTVKSRLNRARQSFAELISPHLEP
jgi:RNA polymerase sigma-70 factor (ECF subfamily)